MVEWETVSSQATQTANFTSSSSSDDGVFGTITLRQAGNPITGLYHVQQGSTTDLNNSLTATVTLSQDPDVGHLIIVSWWNFWGSGGGSCPTVSSLQDSNSNAYTVEANSFCNSVNVAQGYLLKAPSNAKKDITITYNNSAGNYSDALLLVDDFYYPVGTVTLDAYKTNTGAVITCGTSNPFTCSGPTINVPTTGDLVYAAWIVPDNGAPINPIMGAFLPSSSWIGGPSSLIWDGTASQLGSDGHWQSGAEYLASSASGNQTMTFYSNFSGDDNMGAISAFKFVPAAAGGHSISF